MNATTLNDVRNTEQSKGPFPWTISGPMPLLMLWQWLAANLT